MTIHPGSLGRAFAKLEDEDPPSDRQRGFGEAPSSGAGAICLAPGLHFSQEPRC